MSEKPSILEKEKMRILLANSLVKADDNNNTVDLECCALNGVPKPKLTFLLGTGIMVLGSSKHCNHNQNPI